MQWQEVDFGEVFVPMARLDTVRLIHALVAQHRWEIHHLDVESTFLNGDLQEVYVAQSEGFINKESFINKEGRVYKLSKTKSITNQTNKFDLYLI